MNCPFCESNNTHPFTRIDENTVEHICEDCGCTFNVQEQETEAVSE